VCVCVNGDKLTLPPLQAIGRRWKLSSALRRTVVIPIYIYIECDSRIKTTPGLWLYYAGVAVRGT